MRISLRLAVAIALAVSFASVAAAGDLAPAEQTALVKKYCAVCHTDRANNGGLSLEHYDAARLDPPLAAMMLSKLRNGAMGAAGNGVPDKAMQEAWVLATVQQALGAHLWSVTRSDSAVTASIVRFASPRQGKADAPIYRLTLTCDAATRQGTMLLTWSPEPQTNRTFVVTADGQAGVPHTLSGVEKMGNGANVVSGRASALLNIPQPSTSLKIADLFPDETVVFPIAELDQKARRELAACR